MTLTKHHFWDLFWEWFRLLPRCSTSYRCWESLGSIHLQSCDSSMHWLILDQLTLGVTLWAVRTPLTLCFSKCWEMSSLSFGSFLALNRLFRAGTKLTCPFLGFLLGATLLLICTCASDSMLLLELHGLHPVATTIQSSIQLNSITESSCSSGRSMSWLQLSLTLLPSLVCPPVSVTPFYMAV